MKICATRFNNSTYRENIRWRENNQEKGCIYNVPITIKNNIIGYKNLIVIEMNNERNMIEGFGIINSRVRVDKKYRMYNDYNYNRYTYIGEDYINRKDIPIEYNEILEDLEDAIFRGRRHIKRGQGITLIPENIDKKYGKIINDLFSCN